MATATNATELSCEGLTVRYGDFTAVDDVSLRLAAGELVAILGPNGAGKSTLLGALMDARPLAAGEARLNGRPLRAIGPAALARQIASIPQDTWLPFPYTALEVVLMGRAPHLGFLGVEQASDLDRCRAELARTETNHLAHRTMGTLSAGERQRVFLARALAQAAPALLLDEPTAHLDIGHQQSTLRLLAELSGEGRLVVAVLHDLNLASAWCPRLVLMSRGAVVADGPPDEVLTEARLCEVYATEVRVVPHPENGRPMVLPAGGAGGQAAMPPQPGG